jgi:metal-responsive CopG/Arc/MetJ family transcriptional regulator
MGNNLIERISKMLYIFSMPTEKPKILITMEDELLTRIDDFRFENRINSRSEAVRQLIEEGLKKSNPPKAKKK